MPQFFSLALHRLALAAGGDAVSVAFENLLGNPSDDGFRSLGARELLQKLGFELFDVGHRSFGLACNATFAPAFGANACALGMACVVKVGRARWNAFDRVGWNDLDRMVKWRECGGETNVCVRDPAKGGRSGLNQMARSEAEFDGAATA